jgi:hypothetical protein
MTNMTPECSQLANALHGEAQTLAKASDEKSWDKVAAASHALANALRNKDGLG